MQNGINALKLQHGLSLDYYVFDFIIAGDDVGCYDVAIQLYHGMKK